MIQLPDDFIVFIVSALALVHPVSFILSSSDSDLLLCASLLGTQGAPCLEQKHKGWMHLQWPSLIVSDVWAQHTFQARKCDKGKRSKFTLDSQESEQGVTSHIFKNKRQSFELALGSWIAYNSEILQICLENLPSNGIWPDQWASFVQNEATSMGGHLCKHLCKLVNHVDYSVDAAIATFYLT